MVEAARPVSPESFEGRGPLLLVRSSIGLELVTDLYGRLHVPARLGVRRRNITARTVPSAFEYFVTAMHRSRVKTSVGGASVRE